MLTRPLRSAHIDRAIYLDTDNLLVRDIADLWDYFDAFNSSHLAAMIKEGEQLSVSICPIVAQKPCCCLNGCSMSPLFPLLAMASGPMYLLGGLVSPPPFLLLLLLWLYTGLASPSALAMRGADKLVRTACTASLLRPPGAQFGCDADGSSTDASSGRPAGAGQATRRVPRPDSVGRWVLPLYDPPPPETHTHTHTHAHTNAHTHAHTHTREIIQTGPCHVPGGRQN